MAAKLTLVLVLALVTIAAEARPAAAVSSITARQSCTASGLDLHLTWRNGRTRLLQQYVDLSFVSNGWAPGTYAPYGPLDGSVEALIIQSVAPGATYYLRINQQTANGTWYPSDTVRFQTQACGAGVPGQVLPQTLQFYEPPPQPEPRRRQQQRDDGLHSLICWLLGC
jgi:hypothetical protein